MAVVLLVVIAIGLWRTRRQEVPAPVIPTALPVEVIPANPAPTLSPVNSPPTPATPVRPRTAKPHVSAQAAAGDTGDLIISSSPAGAAVQIDGRSNSAWTTPLTRTSLPRGPHSVIINKSGYVTESRTVNVIADGRAYVNVTLQSLAAVALVSSEPAGAAIALDGKDIGQVTPVKLTLDEGPHTLTLSKQGFLAETTSFKLVRSQHFQYSPTLRTAGYTQEIRTAGKFKKFFGGSAQDMGTVEVRSNPKGAQVFVSGQLVPKNTPVTFNLNPGSYELEIRADGYAPLQTVVTVEKNTRVKLDEHLTRR